MSAITERGIAASAFMSAQCADVYASAAEAILKAGWEFVGHGWIQKSLQFEEDEAAVIANSADRLERLTGKKLRGWLGPGAGESFDTPDLIKAAGIDWLADWFLDDLPCWMRTKHGPLIAMPYLSSAEHTEECLSDHDGPRHLDFWTTRRYRLPAPAPPRLPIWPIAKRNRRRSPRSPEHPRR